MCRRIIDNFTGTYLLEQLGEVLAEPLSVVLLGPAALAWPPALPVAFLGADGDAVVVLRENLRFLTNPLFQSRATFQLLP